MMRPFLLRLIPFLFLTALLPGCGEQKETHQSSAALGSGDLRWATYPVQLLVAPSLLDGGEAESDLLTAITFWESRAGKTLFHILGKWTASTPPYTGAPNDPEVILANVIYFQAPWPFESNIAGKTILRTEGNRIEKAVIYLNSSTPLCHRLCLDSDGIPLQHKTSRRRLIAHELGHFIGFAHVSDPRNIMYPEIQPGGTLRGLRVDYGLLEKLTR